MPDAIPQRAGRIPVVALAGNPNAGKTSLFNALTGQSQHVGNYPGVTVDKIAGRTTIDGRDLDIVDLPGTYSLTSYSLEEVVTRDFVLKDKPDVIIDVVDSTNLERNLYLLLQFQELGVPIVGALNMTDEAERKGIRIDVPLLSGLLGIPLVPTVGTRGAGKEPLLRAVLNVIDRRVDSTKRHLNYGPELEEAHERIVAALGTDAEFSTRCSLHWAAIKLLEEDADAVSKVRAEHREPEPVLQAARKEADWVRQHFGRDPEVVVAEQRYAYIRGALREAVRQDPGVERRYDATDAVDAIVLNRYLGVPIFFLVMLAVYGLTFLLGNPLSDLVERGFSSLGSVIAHALPTGVLQDFLVDGIIAGVGGVLTFFPIVLLLFLGLSFLEDVGYMARAAFVMDKFLHVFGLHGRSFSPLMVATGCAVPGVMSARTLVNPKDRTLTILISPLMMCGAKAPVVAMLCAAFFPRHAAWLFWGIWVFGWVVALSLGLLFRKTLFGGEDSPFVMELPPYRLPTPRGIASHLWQRSSSYVRKAGTFILGSSVIVWAALHFPQGINGSQEYDAKLASVAQAAATQLAAPGLDDAARARIENTRDNAARRLVNQRRMETASQSFAGRAGHAIEPITLLAGFDWKLNVALFSGIAAKEVIVSTLGVVYGIEDTSAEQNGLPESLRDRLRADTAYSPRAALALMIFVMFYVPCVPTLGVAKKELGSVKWPAFMAGFTLLVASVLAVIVYQAGRFFP